MNNCFPSLKALRMDWGTNVRGITMRRGGAFSQHSPTSRGRFRRGIAPFGQPPRQEGSALLTISRSGGITQRRALLTFPLRTTCNGGVE